MRIIESFSQGKTGDAAVNEDRLVITDDFVAVLDGVTSRTPVKVNGKAGGRFAVELAEEVIKKFPTDIAARAAMDIFTTALAVEIEKHFSGIERPGFALAIYSKYHRSVWRLADPWIMLDDQVFGHKLPLDERNSHARSLVLEEALQKGATVEALQREDVGWKAILPLLKEGQNFANKMDPCGYGVINGTPVPDGLIHVIDAKNASEIVLASDGYPEIFPTLEKTEARLAEILKEDPLLFRAHKSTKGLAAGNVSFDDRTYVRFEV